MSLAGLDVNKIFGMLVFFLREEYLSFLSLNLILIVLLLIIKLDLLLGDLSTNMILSYKKHFFSLLSRSL